MFSTRATWSNAALMPSTDDVERILREQELSIRTVYNHEGPMNFRDDEQGPVHSLDQTFQSLDREFFPPFPASRAQSVLAAVKPETESYLHIWEFFNVLSRKKQVTSSREVHFKRRKKLSKTSFLTFSPPAQPM